MNKEICDIIYKYFHYFQFKEVLEEYESKKYIDDEVSCVIFYKIFNEKNVPYRYGEYRHCYFLYLVDFKVHPQAGFSIKWNYNPKQAKITKLENMIEI